VAAPNYLAFSASPGLNPFVQALADLKNFVDACIPCPPGPKPFLLDKIDLALAQLRMEHHRATVSALEQFVHRTEHFLSTGELSRAEGERFIAEAEAIIAQLEGIAATR
jgi:hypothetical protein